MSLSWLCPPPVVVDAQINQVNQDIKTGPAQKEAKSSSHLTDEAEDIKGFVFLVDLCDFLHVEELKKITQLMIIRFFPIYGKIETCEGLRLWSICMHVARYLFG